MSTVLIAGAGPIGSTLSRRMAADGHDVVLVSRSGRGPAHPGVRRVALDAGAPDMLELAQGCDVLVNAINLPYHRWAIDWPPLHRNLMLAAERSGAPLALIGNFYTYPADVVMSPDVAMDPPTRKGAVRARMWEELLAAQAAGRLRTMELRASDYIGPAALETENAHGGRRLVEPVLAGRRAWVVGNPDAPHMWTSVDDIARTAATLVLDDRAWGRAWHVPNAEPRSIRQLAADVARAGGAPEPRVSGYPRWMLSMMGLADARLREVLEMRYQFDRPFLSDDSETTAVFGLTATPWQQTIEETVAAARRDAAKALA
ncbi:NAD-dependent epimerase [Desertihabitans brevis]|uniref:NAD-dependent epimerase n=1 Tax=Desertihabitans brevis TaxID=2268447 RepID=A0A367YR09_9ACTN|nr:NAD-dependent epimerase/dehydratase family protein [Desertihabitans brevis]RCK67979.1 NAD-dependent epimerase [Desertihabitans brevis]